MRQAIIFLIFSFIFLLILFADEFKNKVLFYEKGDFIEIKSNGIPNHKTGRFPNRGNPHTIKQQSIRLRITAYPKIASRITKVERASFGVALNGVLFDPLTAEFFGKKRGERGPPPRGKFVWNEEAIKNGIGSLGLDFNNAHVQPSGNYHYHGMPPTNFAKKYYANFLHIGYAADGFKILVDKTGKTSSSYRLKKGFRPSGPKGVYDGTYTQDYEYVKGIGDLDECNGKFIGKQYYYFITKTYPYIPRFWKGTPNESFF